MDSAKSEMDKILGTILKQYRIKAGFTQSKLSEKLGISEKYVSRIETGMGGLSKETLIKYMNILGISPNTLYKDFINNPNLKTELEISEQLRYLSEDKLKIVLEMTKLLRNLNNEEEK